MTTWTQVDQNTNLYESSAAATSADYVLSMNMTAANLFTSAHYRQNSANAELYDVKVTLNAANILSALSSANVGISNGNASPAVSPDASGTAGELLLQVMAVKIFNHPKAAAAIANDSDYISSASGKLMDKISSGLDTQFSIEVDGAGATSATSHTTSADLVNLFEYIVELGRVSSSDDVTDWVSMDIRANDTFTFPFYLHGSLLAGSTQPGAANPLLAYYEDSTAMGKDGGQGFIAPSGGANSNVTGAPLNQGQYDIPLRLDITIV